MRYALLSLVTLLAVTGCASDVKDTKPTRCPQVAIVRELELFDKYTTEQRDADNRLITAKLQSVDGSCRYRREDVLVKFDLAIAAQKGSQLTGNSYTLPFFVAIVDANDHVIKKELMTANIAFKEKTATAESTEPLKIIIPGKGKSLEDYRVLVGFQLSEEQRQDIGKPRQP